ncbi:MAG: FG-GAP repeat domain-containing protein, partial [Acidimicrobiales bacterium]
MTRSPFWGRMAVLAGAGLLATLLVAAPGVGPAGATLAGGQARWSRDVTGMFLWGSPVIADVDGDGSADVVAGSINGQVYAVDANGADLAGWPAAAVVSGGATAVASSPAVGDLDGDG